MDARAKKETSSGSRARAFDLRRRYAEAIAVLQHLVRTDRLAIDTDQEILRFAARQALAEKLRDGGVLRDIDVVRETAAVIVDEQNPHSAVP